MTGLVLGTTYALETPLLVAVTAMSVLIIIQALLPLLKSKKV